MREITPNLTPELEAVILDQAVQKAQAYPVNTYRELVAQIAKLAFFNKDYLFFFRGQSQDYKKRGGASTFYPSIYRGDVLTQNELKLRFRILDDAESQLRYEFERINVDGNKEVKRKQLIRWSILQHYEVCATPLLDFTQSIPVACSFAQRENNGDHFYVFVFGMPYITNRISLNSEHDIVNIRLLSICPPDALRPYFQEGYLAGTDEIKDEYENKTELDFTNRLIAKFQIPNHKKFWGRSFSKVPDTLLFPKGDIINRICQDIRTTGSLTIGPGEIGMFLTEWTKLESVVMNFARDIEPKTQSLVGAIKVLSRRNVLDKETAKELHQLRHFRNRVVHEPEKASANQLHEFMDRLSIIRNIVPSR